MNDFEKKICPVLTTNTVVGENGEVRIGTQPVYCLEAMCAWFNEETGKCGKVTV